MKDFDLRKYLGTWFEIARIKTEFEPEMTDVKAEYSLGRDGSVRVVNSGYVGGRLNQISGVAEPTKDPGVLRLSFFPGQESEYRILFVSNDYSYALVGGEKDNLLWVLSREKTLDDNILKKLIDIALEVGYKASDLVLTKHHEGI